MNNSDDIFSEEYVNSEKTEAPPSYSQTEQTTALKEDEYSISKPKRLIIKATIKND